MIWRLLPPLLVLAGCTRPNPAYDLDTEGSGQASGTGAEITDAGDGSTSATAEGTSGGRPAPCEADDPDLAACYHFPPGESSVLVDGSTDPVDGVIVGLNALIGSAMGFDYAADVGPTTRITVAETGVTDDLDVTGPITFMALFWRRDVPIATRAGILDKEGQYSIFVDASGRPSCHVADTELVGPSLPPEQWTHVACAYDGMTVTLFVDGAQAAQAFHDEAIPQNEGALEIGGNSPSNEQPEPERLDGHVDAVEIWSRSLTKAEVCTRARIECEG